MSSVPASPSACAPLCLQTARAKKEAPPESATDKVLAEEADMMRHITQKQALRAAKELATDTVYTRSMSTGWKPTAEARESPGTRGSHRLGLACGPADSTHEGAGVHPHLVLAAPHSTAGARSNRCSGVHAVTAVAPSMRARSSRALLCCRRCVACCCCCWGAGRWGPRRCQGIRDKFHISVSGDNIPPPAPTFDAMKLPPPVLK